MRGPKKQSSFFLNSMGLGFIRPSAVGFLLVQNNNHYNGLRKNERKDIDCDLEDCYFYLLSIAMDEGRIFKCLYYVTIIYSKILEIIIVLLNANMNLKTINLQCGFQRN